MNCPICGAFNGEGLNTCVKCGSALASFENASNVSQQAVSYEQPIQQQSYQSQTYQQQVYQQQVYQQPTQQSSYAGYDYAEQTNNTGNFNYVEYLVGVLITPFKKFKSSEGSLKDLRVSIILTSIVSVLMMLITLITTMITTVVDKKLDWSIGKYKTVFKFENLKYLDYLDLIVKNFLIFAGVMLVLAAVYFVIGILFKKESAFPKLLSVSATSLFIYTILGTLLSTILGIFLEEISTVVLIIGFAYSVIVFLTLISDIIKFENKDKTIYFHLASVVTVIVIAYIALKEMISIF